MTRAAALVALLVALVALLVPAGAEAAVSMSPPLFGSPSLDEERPPLAQMSAGEARALAFEQGEIKLARALRPDATVRVRWLPADARWRISVRSRDATTLALIEVDDASGRIVRRESLGIEDYPPRSTERDAIDAAVADAGVRRTAREWGGVEELRAKASIDGCCWQVDFYAPKRDDGGDPLEAVIRAEVHDAGLEVDGPWTGIQIPWRMARGEREAFGGDVNVPTTWYALCLLFLIVVVDWSRLRSWANADALALLAFAASYEAFVQGEIDWSVPLAVPPLLWLIVRMAWLFARGVPRAPTGREPRSRVGRLALRPVPTILLVVLCVALAGLRIGLTLEGGNVIDVGYASVAGARLELDGTGPWGNMPEDVARGDTYGPANYLAYVPATALLDEEDEDPFGSRMPAAQATAIAADIGCALLLALIGWRWLSRRAGALLAAGWLACPWTMLVLASGANDSLVPLALLAAFAALPRAWLRGGFVAVAALVKVAPVLVLAPMLHVGGTGRRRQATLAVTGFVVTIVAGLAWATWRLDGSTLDDLRLLWDRTVAFQAGRDSPFSIWGLYGWDVAQQVVRGLVVAGVALACVRPRVRDAWQVAAGVAAVLAAVQLTADHWFYLYLPWLVPFVLIACVARRERPAPDTNLA